MPKRTAEYKPMQVFLDAMPTVSGNTVNGLGETEQRRASPFFWHPPHRQTHGELQQTVTDYHRQSPEMRVHFNSNPPGGRGPEAVEKAAQPILATPEQFSERVKSFAIEHESDVVGITAMDSMYIYEDYELDAPWVILIGVGMDFDEISQAPASFENPTAGVVVAKEYNRAARACREVRNFILSQGYNAKAWQGPYASALNMIPAAIAAGLGELGKHGSMINRELGARFRLSAVTTDMPLVPDQPDSFGIDDYCSRCQACTHACPPNAISDAKQLVRGVEKWYVDFDKCIPYFGETLACGICLAKCPWSRPGLPDRLLEKVARRDAKKNG